MSTAGKLQSLVGKLSRLERWILKEGSITELESKKRRTVELKGKGT